MSIAVKVPFFIDQTFHDMRQGDLFVIPGNTIHRAFPDHIDPVTSTAVFFSPLLIHQASFGESFPYLQCFEQGKQHKNYKFALPPLQQRMLASSLKQMNEEIQNQETGYRDAVVLLLHQILLHYHRKADRTPHRGPFFNRLPALDEGYSALYR